jgi:hypothetical protein
MTGPMILSDFTLPPDSSACRLTRTGDIVPSRFGMAIHIRNNSIPTLNPVLLALASLCVIGYPPIGCGGD